jgi:predicted  nucleic acid-binding Zn-ribbon protein
MTEHELLELVIQKITGIEQKITGIEQRTSGIEQKITGVEQKVTGIEQDVKLIKIQQSEHGELIHSLVHSSEVQKAQYDALQMEVAKLSGEMNKGFSDITEVQKSLLEMYGDHEAKIRILQRKPV